MNRREEDRGEKHLHLVHRAVNAACRRYPAFSAYRDDMTSAGYVTLLEVLDGPQRDVLLKYLSAALRRDFMAEANKLHETYRSPRSEGRVRKARDIVSLDEVDNDEGLTVDSEEDAILVRIDYERGLLPYNKDEK